MNPTETLQHELACRRIIIDELMAEKERILGMVNRANEACHRLRDEVVFVTAQTHAVVKAMMLLNNDREIALSDSMLLKARGYILEKVETESEKPEGVRFKMREHTDEEKALEENLRAKVEGAEQRIIES